MNDDKAAKALRLMLGSDKPGEVMAARDAFIRLMGGDIHAIADRFSAVNVSPAKQQVRAHKTAQRPRSAEDEADAEAIKEARGVAAEILAAAADDPSVRLNQNEIRFLHQMKNTKWPPSPKQRAWLFIIWDKVLLDD